MIIFGRFSRKTINPNVRILFKPMFIIAFAMILATYLVKEGYSQVSKQISEYRKNQEARAVLSNKILALKEVRVGVLDQGDKTLIALPSKNPATSMISQLKFLSNESSLPLGPLEFSTAAGVGGLNTMVVRTSIVSQDLNTLYNFLNNISTLSPISTLKGANIEAKAGGYSLEIELVIYWSDFPTALPSISEPVKQLSDKEKQIITAISGLKVPAFTSLEPSAPSARGIPFN